MRSLLDKYSQEPEFHHVLTELAFLHIRKDEHRSRHGIIPIALNGADVRQYLSFLETSDVFIHNREPRELFFKLLKRIFAARQDVIDEIEKCYTSLADKQEVSDNDISISIHNTIQKMIENGSATYRAQDRSLAGKTSRHFTVPFAPNKDFVGRKDILQQLLQKIPPNAEKDNCQRIAIEGLGGIGKTHITIKAAYEVRDAYPDCSVFWVPAIDLTTFDKAYRKIGNELKLPSISEKSAEEIRAEVKAALSQESAGSWLLIVDNADDAELLTTTLKKYLPSSHNGSLLFTTRNRKVSAKLGISLTNVIPVREMDDIEAAELLQTGFSDRQKGDIESTKRLLKFLVNLPLAIKQASAFMMEQDATVLEYLKLCEKTDAHQIKILSENFEDDFRYEDISEKQNPVATTWLISFQNISQEDRQAAMYLKFISFLAEKDIPVSLLPIDPESNEIGMRKSIGTLYAYAFITKRNTPDTFDIHRLVRLVMRNWLQEEEEWVQWTANVVQQLTKAYPFPTHKNRERWMEYLPHGQAVLEIDGAVQTIEDSGLLGAVAESYYILGKYSQAERLYRQTLELRERVLGRENPDTLASMNNLAFVLNKQGRYEQAEEMYRQTLELKDRVLGRENPSTLTSMNNLAFVLDNQGKTRGAKKHYLPRVLKRCFCYY
ncbi:P-loop containing nucleoside triphosphate hydrolase protein [Astrocystis sublimbata]|nr:P-loop containing nucleoside triphosphate hydrolase protein [Astrocystis sublimbata]